MKRESGFIYVVQMEGHSLYKIGRSSNIPRRMSEIGIQLPFPYRLLFAHSVPNMYYAESDIHRDLAEYRRNGEWFELPESALPYLESTMMLTQAFDLADRVAQAFAEDAMYPDRLERYGRLFIRFAARIERRRETRYKASEVFTAHRQAADVLNAEVIG